MYADGGTPRVAHLFQATTNLSDARKSDKPAGGRMRVKGGRHIACIPRNFLGIPVDDTIAANDIISIIVHRPALDIPAVKW